MVVVQDVRGEEVVEYVKSAGPTPEMFVTRVVVPACPLYVAPEMLTL
jgi:hypothetical protein